MPGQQETPDGYVVPQPEEEPEEEQVNEHPEEHPQQDGDGDEAEKQEEEGA